MSRVIQNSITNDYIFSGAFLDSFQGGKGCFLPNMFYMLHLVGPNLI